MLYGRDSKMHDSNVMFCFICKMVVLQRCYRKFREVKMYIYQVEWKGFCELYGNLQKFQQDKENVLGCKLLR